MRAQGLPISVIIIAILALLTLVVLGFMLMGGFKRFGIGVATCPGECKHEECGEGETLLPGNFSVDKTGKTCAVGEKCCIAVFPKRKANAQGSN